MNMLLSDLLLIFDEESGLAGLALLSAVTGPTLEASASCLKALRFVS
jgi:hypothetical protein